MMCRTGAPTTVARGPRWSRFVLVTDHRTPTESHAHAPFRAEWPLVVLIFALGRAVSGLLLMVIGEGQRASFGPGDLQLPLAIDPPSYLHMLSNWDGQWYLHIVEQGYPLQLPVAGGAVVENAWAFYPAFPGVVSALTTFGLSPYAAATTVSTLCAALAMLVLYRMLREGADRFTATLTVTALAFGPTSLLLQAAYTEGMALLEILVVLWALRERRYRTAGIAVLLLALTRPVALPLAAVIGILWIIRLRRRHVEDFPRGQMVSHALLALGTAASFAVWPAVCGVLTGQSDAYAQTQRAWLDGSTEWITWLSPIVSGEGLDLLVVSVPALALLMWLGIRRGAQAWGADLRAWAVVYPLFILAVSRPTTSVFRYLSLTAVSAWPLPDLSARVRSTPARTALLAFVILVGTITQYFWIQWFWVITDSNFAGHP